MKDFIIFSLGYAVAIVAYSSPIWLYFGFKKGYFSTSKFHGFTSPSSYGALQTEDVEHRTVGISFEVNDQTTTYNMSGNLYGCGDDAGDISGPIQH